MKFPEEKAKVALLIIKPAQWSSMNFYSGTGLDSMQMN